MEANIDEILLMGVIFLCCDSCFKEWPHPDEKQRLDLSRKLNLEPRQVKFWFQNRRTQMKVSWCFSFPFVLVDFVC